MPFRRPSPPPQPEPNHDFDPDLFQDTVTQRYLISSPAVAIKLLTEDVNRVHDAFLHSMTESEAKDCSQELHMISAGFKGLQKLGFSQREYDKFMGKIVPELNSKFRAISIKCLEDHYDSPLYRGISDQAEAMGRFLLRFMPSGREALHTPILKKVVVGTAAAVALVMAISSNAGAKNAKVHEGDREDDHPIAVSMAPVGEDGEALDPLESLRKKYEKALEDGTFTYNEFFRDIEEIAEKVPSSTIRDAEDVLRKDLKKLHPVLSKLSKKDFLKVVRQLVHSPEYDDDKRNFRAASSTLLTEETRTGNCEARARAVLRYIEKERPELLKELKVVISKPHENIGHVELALDDGDSLLMLDNNLLRKIPNKPSDERQIATPEEFFVKSFLRQQKIATEEAEKKRKSRSAEKTGGAGQNAGAGKAPSGNKDTVASSGEKNNSAAGGGSAKKIADSDAAKPVQFYRPPSYVTDTSNEFKQKRIETERQKRLRSYWAEKLKTKNNHITPTKIAKKEKHEKGKKYAEITAFMDADIGSMKPLDLSNDNEKSYTYKGKLYEYISKAIKGDQFKELYVNLGADNMKFLTDQHLISVLKGQNFVTDAYIRFDTQNRIEGVNGSDALAAEVGDTLRAVTSYDLDKLQVEGMTPEAVDAISSQRNLASLVIDADEGKMSASDADLEKLGEHVSSRMDVLETLSLPSAVFDTIATPLSKNRVPPYLRIASKKYGGDITPATLSGIKEIFESQGNRTTILIERDVSLQSLISLLSLPDEYFKNGFLVLNVGEIALEHDKGYDWNDLLPQLPALRKRYAGLTKYAQDDRYISGYQGPFIQDPMAITDHELMALSDYIKASGSIESIEVAMDGASLEQKKIMAKKFFQILPLQIKSILVIDETVGAMRMMR